MAGPCGRGSIMEQMSICRDRQRFDRLADAYRCLLAGSCPRESATEVVRVIFSGVCRARAPAERCHDSAELTCISVSLVDRITSSLTTQSLPPEVALYCGEILRLLFQDMDLMSQLVHQFLAEDQIISHLAAKCASAWVFHHLHIASAVSPVWEQKCVQAFQSSPPGAELDSCLWSLTEVLKRLLRGARQEVLGKVLAAFDGSLMALCSRFLLDERTEAVQRVSSSRRWGTTFCLLLDLLEVLTASSLMCPAGVSLTSQRITYMRSSALLTTISCSSEYFVRKRALLLLKRAVLQRAGEDWAPGEGLSTELKYKHLGTDLILLAHSVLTAVAAKWLQSVEVESASFFGGTRHVQASEGQKPDCVMLRAVSLLLLKSMELHVQSAEGAAGVGSAAEVYGYLQSLWGFLSRCSVQLMEVTHLCCWVSLLFGEQDDDMMEAAKALLSIFLHHRRSSGLDDFTVLEAACASGCNSHCHFLLLLQSISFDHSLLLDFLISTETCFLEYFVRYLRCLRADWSGFTAACGRMSAPDCHLSHQQTLTSSGGGDMFPSRGEPGGAEFSSCVQPTAVVSAVEVTCLAAGLRLVEYASSDESGPENMEDSQDQPQMSVCDKGRCTALDVYQEISGAQVPITQKPIEAHPTLERPSLQGLEGEQTWCPSRTPGSGQVTCEAAARAVLCLSELRQVVMRLQTKRLFPYNPSSLVRLLEQVENCSQQSHLSHPNK